MKNEIQQANLTMMMDGDDVVMCDANENENRPHHLDDQKPEISFTLPPKATKENDLDDDDEAYINIKLSKKRAEMALAAYFIPDTTSNIDLSKKSTLSDHCQCGNNSNSNNSNNSKSTNNSNSKSDISSNSSDNSCCNNCSNSSPAYPPQPQQQHYYYYSNQYHHYHHYHHHYQPYFHGGTTVVYNNGYNPLPVHSGPGMNQHGPSFFISSAPDITDTTSLIELDHHHPPPTTTTTCAPPTPPIHHKKRPRRPTTDNGWKEEEEEEEEEEEQINDNNRKCHHKDQPTLKKQKHRNKK